MRQVKHRTNEEKIELLKQWKSLQVNGDMNKADAGKKVGAHYSSLIEWDRKFNNQDDTDTPPMVKVQQTRKPYTKRAISTKCVVIVTDINSLSTVLGNV